MARGDSQLSNTSRLLAAQELNRRILAEKAAKKVAEIEAERKKEAEKRFNRQRELLAKQTKELHPNIQKFQQERLEKKIAKQKATAKEQARIAELNQKAALEKKKEVERVARAKGGNVGLITGRVAIRDDKGKVVGISNTESKSAIEAKKRIVTEIQRREVERTKVTDLERFLQNEQRLASGNITTSELKRQIADRKKRGLSKTPQQKRLLQQRSDQELDSALAKRGGTVSSISQLRGESERSRAKSLSNFGSTQNAGFNSVRGAGRSFQARAKDSSIGQINSQLAVLQKKRKTKSKSALHNENVALQIASGNFFTGLSRFDLSNIVSGGQGDNPRKAPSAKESVGAHARRQAQGNSEAGLRSIQISQSSPFAIIAQQDIPDPDTGITDRQVQLFREDIIRSNRGKAPQDRERVPDTSEFFPSGRAPRADDPFNDFSFGNFGGVDTTKLDIEGGDIANPFAVDTSLVSGGKDSRGRGFAIFSDTQSLADIEASRKEANKNKIQQSTFDLQALGTQLDQKNFIRGKAIEAENALRPPRFSSGIGVTVQRNQQQPPTQLQLQQKRDNIGGVGSSNVFGSGLTESQIRQETNNELRIQGFSPSEIRTIQQGGEVKKQLTPKEKKKLADTLQKETQALRDQGGLRANDIDSIFLPSSAPASSSDQAGRFIQSPERSIFQSVPTPPQSSVNLFETIGVSDNVKSNEKSVDLFESIGLGDSVQTPSSPKTTKKPTKTQIKQQKAQVKAQQQAQVQTPTPTPTPPVQQAGLNAFGFPTINLVPDFLVGSVPKAKQAVAGVIDSPFTDFAFGEIQGAIAKPKQTIKQAQSSANFLFDIASGNDPFKVTGKTQPLLSFEDSLKFSGLR